jgi:hypothetical protein
MVSVGASIRVGFLIASVSLLPASCSSDTKVTQASGPGGGETTSAATGPTATGSSEASDAVTACDLFTQELAEQAFGTTFPAGQPRPAPLGGTSCTYIDRSSGALATLIVTPAPGGATAFQSAKAEFSSDEGITPFFHEIDGLGDEAFTNGLSVFVLTNGIELGVAAGDNGTKAGDTSVAEEIASDVLARL